MTSVAAPGTALLAPLFSALLLAAPLQAQSVLLRVSDAATAQPLQGTLVVLRNPAGEHVGSALTDPRGRFLFVGVAPGDYTVRGELIGYASREAAVTVAAGETALVELRLDSRAIELEGISVEGEGRCTLRPEAGLRVAEVWDEVRKALEASRWTNEHGVYEYRTRHYLRDVDGETGMVTNQQSRRGRVYLNTPYESRPARDLMENGFVQRPTEGSGGDLYFAPDASVLLSDLFLDSHCMRLRSGEGEQAGLVGLTFEPVRGRRIPDIAGTLWVDPESWRLSHLEYTYENVSTDVQLRGIGGEVAFQLLPNGTWIVPEWQIRVPLLALGRDGRGRETVFQQGYREEGASVLSVREPGGEVLFSAGTAALEGVVLDGITSEPVADAVVSLVGTGERTTTDDQGRFRFSEVVPGRYEVVLAGGAPGGAGHASEPVGVDLAPGQMVSVTVTRADPLALHQAACREEIEARPRGSAILAGRVLMRTSDVALEGARVTIEWDDFASVRSLGYVTEEGLVSTTGADGRYRACVVPEGRLLRITAEWQGSVTRQDTVLVPEGEPGLVHDIRMHVEPDTVGAPSAPPPDYGPPGAEVAAGPGPLSPQVRRGFPSWLRRSYLSARDPSHSMRLWAPSQKGLLADWPHRHR